MTDDISANNNNFVSNRYTIHAYVSNALHYFSML